MLVASGAIGVALDSFSEHEAACDVEQQKREQLKAHQKQVRLITAEVKREIQMQQRAVDVKYGAMLCAEDVAVECVGRLKGQRVQMSLDLPPPKPRCFACGHGHPSRHVEGVSPQKRPLGSDGFVCRRKRR